MDTIRKVTAVLMILAALFLNGIGIDVALPGNIQPTHKAIPMLRF